jgi:hypothetical protein
MSDTLTSLGQAGQDRPDTGNGNLLQGTKDKQLLSEAEQLFNDCKQQRWQFERIWYQNLAFYYGHQNLRWLNRSGGQADRMVEPPAPSWRVRMVINKIRPLVRKELAKLTKEQPQAFVMPASTDEQDLLAARAGESVFEHLWKDLELDRVVRQIAFWVVTTGTGFVKDWFSPNTVDKATNQRGLIEVESLSPWHLFVPNLQEEDIERQPYVIHVVAKDPSWVQQVYGKQVRPNSSAGNLDQRFKNAMGLRGQNSSNQRLVEVREVWIKPNKKHPQGAVIAWTDDQLLTSYEGWPYNHQEYPFAKVSHVPTGQFYADSIIPDLIPVQKELNRTRSQVIESKNRMAKPQLIAPKGSVDPNKVTSEPGLIVFYTPGFDPPQPLPLQPLPNYVLQEVDRLQQDMSDISYQHEVTQGTTPPGVTAATAISYLQEEDDSVLAATTASIEEAIAKLGRHFLNHVKQFWTAQRKIRVIGQNGQFESQMLSGADIGSNTDLRVEAGSAAPRSMAAKQAFITELGKLGWISPDRALKYMGMAETGRMYEESQVDPRHAQRENLKLVNGDDFAPNSWDNHEVHIMEHNNFRKQQEFELADDQQKAALERHVQAHQQILAQLQGQLIPPNMPGIPQQPQENQTQNMQGSAQFGPQGQAQTQPQQQGGQSSV